MTKAVLASLFAGFLVAAVIFFVGPENAGWAIWGGLVTTGMALLLVWLVPKLRGAV